MAILEKLKELLIPWYVLLWIYPKRVRTFRKRIREIRKRGKANVVFLAASLAMWKYQGLYELLSGDPKFRTRIILAPFYSFSEEQKEKSMRELSAFFNERDIPCTDAREIKDLGAWLRDEVKPDLIFYPQPYEWIFKNELDWTFHPTSLIAYVPYGALTLNEPWIYNARFIYNAWRVYYQSSYNREIARTLCYNRGLNVRVSGYITIDDFNRNAPKDVWKPQDRPKKRIIWAPHFSGIRQPNWLNRGAFRWLWEYMREMAVRYKDTVQIAFKPHPRLLSELYDSPEWGKEKTDAYYAWWANGENTQLETGAFIPLFQTSDAMIHDCNSFIADYLLTGKPVLFTSNNLEETENQLDDFGKAALHAHYIARETAEIQSFVDRLVDGGDDPKADERHSAYQKYLLPPGGKTASMCIYEDLLKSLKI